MEARALFVICTRVITLHSCYMKNAFVFSQSDARNFFSRMLLIKKPERDERYLSADNLHNWRLPSISTSNIPHVAEDGDWFGVQTEGNKSTDIRSIKKNDLIVLMSQYRNQRVFALSNVEIFLYR